MLGNLSRLEGIYPQNVDYACPPGAHYRQKPLKNTAFLHFSIFAGWHFSMRNKPCKTQCFVYFTHSKHRKLQRLQWGGGPPVFMTRVGGRGGDRISDKGPKGPEGRVLAVGHLPSPNKREGSPPPAADPCTILCFTVFSASSTFPALWLKMGQHGPT